MIEELFSPSKLCLCLFIKLLLVHCYIKNRSLYNNNVENFVKKEESVRRVPISVLKFWSKKTVTNYKKKKWSRSVILLSYLHKMILSAGCSIRNVIYSNLGVSRKEKKKKLTLEIIIKISKCSPKTIPQFSDWKKYSEIVEKSGIKSLKSWMETRGWVHVVSFKEVLVLV